VVQFPCTFLLLLETLGDDLFIYFFFEFHSIFLFVYFFSIRIDSNSDVRNVPDNQEVFADVNTDQSIIIEILQFVHQAANEDAAR
jgi:hypothetical protein